MGQITMNSEILEKSIAILNAHKDEWARLSICLNV